jgi:hypothetical protein
MDFPKYNTTILLTATFFVLGFSLAEWAKWCSASSDPNLHCPTDKIERLQFASAISFSLCALMLLGAFYYNWSEQGRYSTSRWSQRR